MRTIDDRIRRWFTVIQRVLEYAVALFLSAFAAMSLWTAVIEFKGSVVEFDDYTLAITQALDAVLLTIILVELLRTVLSNAPMARRLQEFLIIGVFSAVRYGLEIVAGARGVPHGGAGAIAHPNPRDVVTALAINAVGVFVLVAALWLVRQRGDRHFTNDDDAS
ncbi:MAG: hypothetical protein ACREM8_02295 [Vulcanimicrobiaceae bacterium]